MASALAEVDHGSNSAWLARQRIARALAVVAPRPPPAGYAITLETSAAWGSGTRGRVYFELLGDAGSSGVVFVDTAMAAAADPATMPSGGCLCHGSTCGSASSSSSSGAFRPGGTAALVYPRLPFVGKLRQLRVGTNGRAGWRLRRAEVLHLASGVVWGFDCSACIDAACGFQRILSCSGQQDKSSL
jgi:hypothetical protein